MTDFKHLESTEAELWASFRVGFWFIWLKFFKLATKSTGNQTDRKTHTKLKADFSHSVTI